MLSTSTSLSLHVQNPLIMATPRLIDLNLATQPPHKNSGMDQPHDQKNLWALIMRDREWCGYILATLWTGDRLSS